jgi:predicted DNA-binding transcriptional regulator AlpA
MAPNSTEANCMPSNQVNGPDYPSGGFMGIKEVAKLTSLSQSSVKLEAKNKRFPAPIKLTAGRVAWLRVEVHAWIAEKVEQARGKKLNEATGAN